MRQTPHSMLPRQYAVPGIILPGRVLVREGYGSGLEVRQGWFVPAAGALVCVVLRLVPWYETGLVVRQAWFMGCGRKIGTAVRIGSGSERGVVGTRRRR
eukprot:140114-Rhodomonas_salina.1